MDPNEVGDRVRVAAIGDHLERSEGVLLDLVNTGGQTVLADDMIVSWFLDPAISSALVAKSMP